MKNSFEEFAKRGGRVVVVTMTVPSMLKMWLAENPHPFPFLGDPEKKSYEAFGLQRFALRNFLNPLVLWRFTKQVLRGVKIRRILPGEDALQLGGNFLFAGDKTLFAKWTSSDPTRRPSIPTLLSSLDQLTKRTEPATDSL